MSLINFIKNLFRKNTKVEPVRGVIERAISDEEYNNRRKMKQDEIDAILDKISVAGYDNLSQHEKNILNNLK
jgi:hypothetical protein